MALNFFFDRSDLQVAIVLGCVTLVAGSAYAFWATKKQQQDKYQKLYRPPSTLPLLGNLLDVFFKADEFFEWALEQSKAANWQPWLLSAPWRPPMIVITSPGAVEDATKTQFKKFIKGEYFLDVMCDLLGTGVFTTNGDSWFHRRKTAVNLFTLRAMRGSFASIMIKHGETVIKLLQDQVATEKPIDLCKLLSGFTIEAFAEIGFGIQLNALTNQTVHPFQTAFDTALMCLDKRLNVPVWAWKLQRWLGVGHEKVLQQSLQVINDSVLKMIVQSLERHRNTEQVSGRNDLVSLTLDHLSQKEGNSDDNEDINPVVLRDMVVGFLLAGRDTTAQTLSWFLYHLSQHPRVVQKIREEMTAKIPELIKGTVQFPTMDEVQTLSYLEACIKETLRLCPVIPLNPREAVEDTTLADGTFVPAGAYVMINVYGMGRMTELWGEDAEEYNPDRWMDPNTGKLKNVTSFQFNSFHSGPRICLGMNLAMLEMKIIASGILSKFELDVVPGQTVTYKRAITFPMRDPFMVRVRPLTAPFA